LTKKGCRDKLWGVGFPTILSGIKKKIHGESGIRGSGGKMKNLGTCPMGYGQANKKNTRGVPPQLSNSWEWWEWGWGRGGAIKMWQKVQ